MNPYSVLGVSPTASDAEIKSAYRSLAKKYHPDKYRGHDLEDLAGEKIKEINKAYDMIQQERATGRSTGSAGAGFGGASYSARGGSGRYADIRRAIQQGNLSQADAMLDAISNRNAEWHYLKGLVLLRKNWYDGARQHFATAASMDPGNAEYQNAYRTVNNSASGYGQTYYDTRSGGGDSDCGICNICGGLLCADCCCECCGGDLISCC